MTWWTWVIHAYEDEHVLKSKGNILKTSNFHSLCAPKMGMQHVEVGTLKEFKICAQNNF
jgi:hypothetical protein